MPAESNPISKEVLEKALKTDAKAFKAFSESLNPDTSSARENAPAGASSAVLDDVNMAVKTALGVDASPAVQKEFLPDPDNYFGAPNQQDIDAFRTALGFLTDRYVDPSKPPNKIIEAIDQAANTTNKPSSTSTENSTELTPKEIMMQNLRNLYKEALNSEEGLTPEVIAAFEDVLNKGELSYDELKNEFGQVFNVLKQRALDNLTNSIAEHGLAPATLDIAKSMLEKGFINWNDLPDELKSAFEKNEDYVDTVNAFKPKEVVIENKEPNNSDKVGFPKMVENSKNFISKFFGGEHKLAWFAGFAMGGIVSLGSEVLTLLNPILGVAMHVATPVAALRLNLLLRKKYLPIHNDLMTKVDNRRVELSRTGLSPAAVEAELNQFLKNQEKDTKGYFAGWAGTASWARGLATGVAALSIASLISSVTGHGTLRQSFEEAINRPPEADISPATSQQSEKPADFGYKPPAPVVPESPAPVVPEPPAPVVPESPAPVVPEPPAPVVPKAPSNPNPFDTVGLTDGSSLWKIAEGIGQNLGLTGSNLTNFTNGLKALEKLSFSAGTDFTKMPIETMVQTLTPDFLRLHPDVVTSLQQIGKLGDSVNSNGLNLVNQLLINLNSISH